MKGLGLDVVQASELLKMLEAREYVEFTNRASSVMGRNEYLKVRITGKGILVLDDMWKDLNAKEVHIQQTIGSVVGNVIQAPNSTVNVNTRDSFNGFYKAIDAKSDLSQYEKEDLKRKVAELEEALNKKDKSRFDNVSAWLGKFAPWLIQVFSRPEVQESIEKAFGH
jgi:hypothetical protein